MKLSKFIFFLLVFVLTTQVKAQFAANNYQPCEAETVEVKMGFEPLFCENDPSNPAYEALKYYKFQIVYNSADGTATPISGVGWATVNQISSINKFRFVCTPLKFLNPGQLQVKITGYRRLLVGGAYEDCFTQTIVLNPYRKLNLSGPNLIESPGLRTYSVANIPGVTCTWSIPPDWTMVSNNNYSIGVLPGPTSGNVSVSFSQPIIYCGLPSIYVGVSPCAFSGTTDFEFCGPSTDWGGWQLASSGFGDPNKFPRMMGDFNGDGKSDVIGFGNNSVTVLLSQGTFFNSSTWHTGFTYGNDGSTQDIYPRYVGDFNGDGKDDIIGFGHQYTSVALSTGTAFSTAGFTKTPKMTYQEGYTGNHLPRMVGDFNGDGKDDAIAFGHSSVAVGISTGSSFNVSDWSGGQTFSTSNFGDPDKWPRMLGDFNGDGKTDIIGFGNTSVAVGLSTGSAFDVSVWSNEFTYSPHGIRQSNTPRGIADFNGDGKDDIVIVGDIDIFVALSTGNSFLPATKWYNAGIAEQPQIGSTGSRAKVLFADVNADGMDDLVAFTANATIVAYSNGHGFECPATSHMLELNSISTNKFARFVGNFNNTDDELELVAFDHSDVKVIDCKHCTQSFAKATVNGHYQMQPEVGTQGWVLDVYSFCSNTLSLDLSDTECEDRYFLEIKEFDIATWTAGTTIYNTDWIVNKAPNSIDLSGINLQSGQLYVLNYGVGPDWDVISVGIRITEPNAQHSLSPSQTREHNTNGRNYNIHQICSNILSFNANGTNSTCYDEYRYDLYEINPSTMAPIGLPLQQVPAGDWGTYPATIEAIQASNLVQGKIYAVRLQIRRNGLISTSIRYIEKTNCTIGPPKSATLESDKNHISAAEAIPSTLYPNPAIETVILSIGDQGAGQVSVSIHDAYGKLVKEFKFKSGSRQTIDVTKLASGIYFILLQGNHVEHLTFIKN